MEQIELKITRTTKNTVGKKQNNYKVDGNRTQKIELNRISI